MVLGEKGEEAQEPTPSLTTKGDTRVETLHELRDQVQEMIAGVGSGFTEPDDDWMQMAFLDGEEGIVVMGLMNDLFENGLSKDRLAWMLKHAMLKFKARRYAILFNAHMKAFVSEEEMESVRSETQRIEHMEGAQEVLVLIFGDAEQEEAMMAKISRDGTNPPTLEPWELQPTGWEGRFSGFNELMRMINV